MKKLIAIIAVAVLLPACSVIVVVSPVDAKVESPVTVTSDTVKAFAPKAK